MDLEQIIQQMIDAGESEEAIAAVIQEASSKQAPVAEDPRAKFGRQFLTRLVDAGKGLGNAIANPIDTVKGMHEASMQQFDKAGELWAGGNRVEAVGRGLAGLVPGAPLAGTADAFIEGDFGGATADLAMMGLGAKVPGVPGATRRGVNAGARALETSPQLSRAVGGGSLTGAGLQKGAQMVRRATDPKKAAGFEPHMPNTSGRPGRGAASADASGIEGSVDPYMPNRGASGSSFSDVAEAPPSLRALQYGGGGDDILTGAQQFSKAAGRAPAAGGRTSSARRFADPVEDLAAAKAQYTDDFIEGLPAVEGLQVIDDAPYTQVRPSMGDVDDVISGMNQVPSSRAAKARGRANRTADNDVSSFRKSREHGIAGFRNLPELTQNEVTRIQANIDRVLSRRGQ